MPYERREWEWHAYKASMEKCEYAFKSISWNELHPTIASFANCYVRGWQHSWHEIPFFYFLVYIYKRKAIKSDKKFFYKCSYFIYIVLLLINICFYDYSLNVSSKKFRSFKKLELAYILHKYISTQDSISIKKCIYSVLSSI